MSEIYTPFAAPLGTLLIPSDGDLRNVASVNGPFKKLANAIANISAHPTILQLIEFAGGGPHTSPTTGSFLPPSDCAAAIIEGCGSGGAGAQGSVGGLAFSTASTGGGGGGGAKRIIQVIPIVGGSIHGFVVAAAAAPGQVGTDTTVSFGSTELYRARGGQQGVAGGVGDYAEEHTNGVGVTAVRRVYGSVPGGGSTYALSAPPAIATYSFSVSFLLPRHAQDGGPGISSLLWGDKGLMMHVGGASPEGKAGGPGGTPGANIGSGPDECGGGAGGGGGAGPYGNGAAGGNGSDGVTSGSPTNGLPGADGAAGSGCGGGGGGGTGSAPSGGGGLITGGAGGWSGSGRIRIWLLRTAP